MIGAVARRKKARSEKSFWRSSSEFGKAEVQDQRRNRGTVGFADVNNLRSQISDLRSQIRLPLLFTYEDRPHPASDALLHRPSERLPDRGRSGDAHRYGSEN